MAVSKSRKARMAAGYPGRRQSTYEMKRAILRWTKDKGLEPLTVMLDTMQEAHEKAKELARDKTGTKKKQEENELKKRSYQRQALEAAAMAAPYVHPKLANITHKGDPDAPLAVTIIDDVK